MNKKPARLDGLNVQRHPTLVEQIAESLRQAILGRVLAPGERLVEKTIADQFRVSRGPLREAFGILAAEGYLTTKSNGGTHVVDLTQDDFANMIPVRASLEGLAARLIAGDTEADLAFLQHICDRIQRSVERQDVSDVRDLAWDFHRSMVQMTGNLYLANSWQVVSTPVRIFMHSNGIFQSDIGLVLTLRQQILSILASGDADLAEKSQTAIIIYHGFAVIGRSVPTKFRSLVEGIIANDGTLLTPSRVARS